VKLQKGTWVIIAAGVILALIPFDPTDVLDFGTPILEIIGTVIGTVYYEGRKGK
jgi:hypothetical protein